MVFAFLEDGTLVIHDSAADAIRQYEGIDVESGVVRFYDESGTCLEPRFTTPNRTGKTLGLFRWVVSGTYDLVPNSDAQEDCSRWRCTRRPSSKRIAGMRASTT